MDNKENILRLVDDDPKNYKSVPHILKMDHDIILKIIEKDISLIQFLPEEFDDYEFIKSLVERAGCIFRYLPAKFRCNLEIAKLALKKYRYNIHFLTNLHKDNLKLCLIAIDQCFEGINPEEYYRKKVFNIRTTILRVKPLNYFITRGIEECSKLNHTINAENELLNVYIGMSDRISNLREINIKCLKYKPSILNYIAFHRCYQYFDYKNIPRFAENYLDLLKLF